jgi:phenylacetate-CoA ligase
MIRTHLDPAGPHLDPAGPHIDPARPHRIRLAADLDTLPRAEIDRLQAENLAAMIAAARRTRAVRRRWPGIDGDVRRLPLLYPADVAAAAPPHSAELLLGGDPAGLVLRTSGTAAKAKVMYHSWEFTAQVEQLGARGVRAALPDPPRRVANCMSAGELNGSCLFVHGVTRLLPALALPFGSGTSVADVAAVIAGHGIDTLVAGPAYGADLVTGAPPETLRPLRQVLYLGEAMGAEREQAIAAVAPDLTVRSFAYSTSETGPIGYQCTRLGGSDHHVHEDAILLEIVDGETGEPVADGTPGEVVVTPLSSTGMALFRYRIGDRGYLRPEPCSCGSAARVLTLLGRADQTLTVDTATISSDQLMHGLATLGVGDAADCQLQVLWDFPAYRVRLLLSLRTPVGVDAAAVRAVLAGAYQLNYVLTGPRCTSFTVDRVPTSRFARTERGKVPVLYQRLG